MESMVIKSEQVAIASPQGLKPLPMGLSSGTTEVVPFHKAILAPVMIASAFLFAESQVSN
jgi:hypothetical protein